MDITPYGAVKLMTKAENVKTCSPGKDYVSLTFVSSTYLHSVNESDSAIDHSVTNPSLLLDFSWKVHDDLYESNHFSVILESLNSTVR
jgi:hypothetical protein